MNTWNSIAWFPLCVGLSGVGLVLSWFTWRRRGARRGIRAVAWSLLPLALYLTGSILLVGRIGSAVVQFASSFVFSPKTWAGVILFILSALIFVVSGGVPRLRRRKRGGDKEVGKEVSQQAGSRAPVTAGQATRPVAQVGPAPKQAKPAKQGKGGGGDDGLDPDVAAILRRHGIS
jgi:membrane protein implicated in regulation of membrane protease activity